MKIEEIIRLAGEQEAGSVSKILEDGCDLNMDESELFEIQSRFCRIFSDSKRLRIMWCLLNVEKSVGEIAREFSLSMSNVSQHLRIMRDLGAVVARREGRHVYYTLANRKFVMGSALIREGLKDELAKRRW